MKPVLDNDRKNDVILVLGLDGTIKMAANYVGCSQRALYCNAKRDPEFKKTILRAKSDIDLGCLKTVKKVAHDDQNWRAANQLLKYLDPDQYSRKPDTIPVKHAQLLMTELAAAIGDEIDDDAKRERIHRRFGIIAGNIRDGKTAKQPNRRRSPDQP
jgi:hypothetical protein